jgi:aryl-alcohol dehydrogenase-like predicted oxidoreductase
MQYRTIGNTGIRISEIGFGCGDNAGLIVRATTQERQAGVGRALELGINYFDTSPDYGKGLSEANLGRVFRALRARPVIATKVEIMPGDEDDLAAAVVRSVEGSLRRLRMDYVDIVQIHNPPHQTRNFAIPGWVHLSVEDYLGPRGCLEALERLQRDGKVRLLGFACEHAEAPAVKQLLDTGKFQMLNVWYDLLNPTAGWPPVPGMRVDTDYQQFLDHARLRGCGAAIIRPLAGGTLTDIAVGGGSRHRYAGGGLSRTVDHYQQMVEQARSMAFLSQEGRHTLAQAAIRFSLSHPAVTTVLGGFSDVNQIEEMASCSGQGPLSDENMVRVEMAWRSNFGKWDEQSWAAA